MSFEFDREKLQETRDLIWGEYGARGRVGLSRRLGCTIYPDSSEVAYIREVALELLERPDVKGPIRGVLKDYLQLTADAI